MPDPKKNKSISDFYKDKRQDNNNSKYKQQLELLIQETNKTNQDKKEFETKGYIKNPKSIKYKNKKKELEKKETYLNEDNRTDSVKIIDQNKGEFEIAKKEALKRADVVTDIAQLGNFVPHPAFQTIGKVGNVIGTVIDGYEAYDDFSKGDYINGSLNAASAILPNYLDTKSFGRNSKYSPITNKLNNIFGDFGRTKYLNTLNQVKNQTTQQLNTNRALLGTLGAETIYDTQYAMGGNMKNNSLTQINEGGTHSQNPLGGVPMGQGNSVEQGETKQNNFIYSDRIILNKDIIGQYGLPKSLTNKTVADATKIIDKKFKDRNDKISLSTRDNMLSKIAEAQEAMKPQEEPEQEQMFMGGELDLTETNGYSDPELAPDTMEGASYLSAGAKMLPSLLSGDKNQIVNSGISTGLGIAGTAIGGPVGGMIGSTIGSAVSPMVNKLLNKNKIAKEKRNNSIMEGAKFNNDFAYGGILDEEDPYSDLINKYPNRNPTLAGYNANAISLTPEQLIETNGYSDPTLAPNPTTTNMGKNQSPYPKANLSKLGDTLGQAARYAPIAMNAYQLSKLKKPEYERLNRLDARFKPEYVDEKSLQNIVGNEYDNTVNAITQMGGGEGATRNAILGAGLNKTKALSDAYMNASAQNRQMNMSGQQFNLGVDQANLNQANQELDINDRNQAAYRNEKSKYLAEIGNGIGDVGKEEVYKKIAKTTTGYNWLGEYQKANPNATSKQIQEAALKAGVLATEDDTDTKKSLGGYLIKNKRK